MESRSRILLACLMIASAAAAAAGAETVYKYRATDGTTTYSNRPVPNAELIEVIDYKFASPAARGAAAVNADAAGERRVREHLAALDRGWNEVQEATRALALAEARLAAGIAPREDEGAALGGPAIPASPAVGGPQAPVSPAVGGPQPAAAPAVGGPMGARRGGGRNAEYVNRVAAQEADVAVARARLDAAWRNYNQLR
jgi:hypothetical protein